MLLVHKTCLYILSCITYIFVSGTDAPKDNLLKKALKLARSALNDSIPYIMMASNTRMT